jgi:hypothetical protein
MKPTLRSLAGPDQGVGPAHFFPDSSSVRLESGPRIAGAAAANACASATFAATLTSVQTRVGCGCIIARSYSARNRRARPLSWSVTPLTWNPTWLSLQHCIPDHLNLPEIRLPILLFFIGIDVRLSARLNMKYLLLAPSGAQPAPAARAARWTAGAATWHTTRRCIAVTERLPCAACWRSVHGADRVAA